MSPLNETHTTTISGMNSRQRRRLRRAYARVLAALATGIPQEDDEVVYNDSIRLPSTKEFAFAVYL